MCSLPTFCNLCFIPQKMDLVLSTPKWKLNLLTTNHLHRLLKLCFPVKRQSSLADINRSHGRACFKSLAYIKNVKGQVHHEKFYLVLSQKQIPFNFSNCVLCMVDSIKHSSKV